MRSEYEVNRAVDRYADMIQRICLCHLKNAADTEDVFQDVFIKYMLYEGQFESTDHEKAWLIRVTINACKDHLKSLFHRRELPLDVLAEVSVGMGPRQCQVLEQVLSLPEKYRVVLYLHYYEGYTAAEIGKITKAKENTVYSLLSRGRGLLRDKLGGEGF